MRGLAGDARVAATSCVRSETDAEVDARVLQSIKVPDLGLDGGEMRHGGFGIGYLLVVVGLEIWMRKGRPVMNRPPSLRCVSYVLLVMGVVEELA